jgi:hypothetical protein
VAGTWFGWHAKLGPHGFIVAVKYLDSKV